MDTSAYVLGAAMVGGDLVFPVETSTNRPINIHGGETIYETGNANTTIYLQGTPD